MNRNKLAACAARVTRCSARAAHVLMLLLLVACTGQSLPKLTASDAAEVDQITKYLNSIPRFEAHFSQFGSFGPGAGVIWLDRPAGRLRIEYTDSARVMVIAQGKVLIVDRSNGATTTMPVSSTPLGILLTPRISLSGAVTVADLVHFNGVTQVTLEETDNPSRGSLTLVLTDQPRKLIAVTVIDPHRRTLTMTLSGLDTAATLTANMFDISTLPSGG